MSATLQSRAPVSGTYPHHPLPAPIITDQDGTVLIGVARMPFRSHREVRMVAGFRHNPPPAPRRWWSWLTDPLASDPMQAEAMVAAELRRQDELNRSMCAILSAILLASAVVWWLAGGVA